MVKHQGKQRWGWRTTNTGTNGKNVQLLQGNRPEYGSQDIVINIKHSK